MSMRLICICEKSLSCCMYACRFPKNTASMFAVKAWGSVATDVCEVRPNANNGTSNRGVAPVCQT